MASSSIQQTLEQALTSFHSGNYPESERLCRQVLVAQSNHPEALNLLGMLASAAGHLPFAAEMFGKASANHPGCAEYLVNLGTVLDPLGRPDQAVAAYRQAIALKPDLPEAHSNLGNALFKLGQHDQAIASFGEAIRLRPNFADALFNLGNAYMNLGHDEQAIEFFQRAITVQPNRPNALNNLGMALVHLRRWDEAIVAYRRAIAVAPERTEIQSNLADAHYRKGEMNLAIELFTDALRRKPDLDDARSGLPRAYRDNGQVHDAIAAYDQLIAARPNDWQLASARVYALTLHPNFDSQAQLREQRAWAARFADGIERRPVPRQSHSRVRVGYVSPDFRNHVVARNTLPLLKLRNRERFEVFCYSNVQHPDSWTRKFIESADQFRDILKLDDAKAANLVRADGIDLLVDLSLHTPASRLLLMARKPAPVQVTFAGYPGGIGMEAIDWRLTDPYLDPPGETDGDYVEKSYRLPDSFWCYDREGMECQIDQDPAPLPALTNGFVTFGCLNNFCKVNEGTLDLWARVMNSLSNSRLLLMTPPSNARQRVQDRLARYGISAERIEFVSYQKRVDYLAQFNRIDLGLDTLPYNGHTTSLDALWMGVPVISCVGRTVMGRAGFSQLSNLKLTELVARNDDQFVAIARDWASNLDKLADLRRSLRQRMLASPLMDSQRFVRNIESAYEEILKGTPLC